MLALLFALLAMLTTGAALAQQPGGCQYQGAIARPGARFLSTSLTVPRDGRCSHALGGNGGDIQIVTPPQHGRVEFTNSSVTYIAAPAYVGRDEYVFSTRTTGGPTQVTVSVEVR